MTQTFSAAGTGFGSSSAGSNVTAQASLSKAGAVTGALLDALNQVQQQVAASQVGPDGNPSQTALYMHMPMGYPVDPKMFANAWTPGGGDSAASFSNDGTFVAPTPAAAPATATAKNGSGPPGAVYPPPQATTDPVLQASIQSAFYTAQLVDNMLEVTNNGVAVAWPDRQVSIEYYGILEGMQPQDTNPPAQSVIDAVAAAQKFLYIEDDNGNPVGYTQIYAQYIRNRKAWTDAIGAQAAAYAVAMTNPAAGEAWPVEAATYANAVTQALNDFNSMGRQQVEAALNTIDSEGQNVVSALVALGKSLYGAYGIQLAGSISASVPWSYISPISWWDHTDDSMGVQSITGSSSNYAASSASGTSSFANGWQNSSSSSMSASAGINVGFASASGSYSHAQAADAMADHSGQSGWQSFNDKSSSASISLEFFVASIERPWLLGDLLNIQGWYLFGQKAASISDGTINNQIGDGTKLFPMIPKAFVIMRNVSITADDWGDAGAAFQNAQQSGSASGQSSSNSMGLSASYFCAHASMNAANQQQSSAFGNTANSNTSWAFSSDANGGTLKLMGSQIIGWIGEIQPKAPLIDDPTLAAASNASSNASATSTSTSSPTTTATTASAQAPGSTPPPATPTAAVAPSSAAPSSATQTPAAVPASVASGAAS